MTGSPSTIQFLGDWRHQQHGTIERGSRLTLNYDKTRLLDSFAPWRGAEFGDIVALCRFHPRGDIVSGSVVAPVRDRENPPGIVISHVPQPLDLPVPPDATHAEIWFHGFYQTSTRRDGWDSRFGENYWFEIGGPSPRVPTRPVKLPERRGYTARRCERAGAPCDEGQRFSSASGRRTAPGHKPANIASGTRVGPGISIRSKRLDRRARL